MSDTDAAIFHWFCNRWRFQRSASTSFSLLLLDPVGLRDLSLFCANSVPPSNNDLDACWRNPRTYDGERVLASQARPRWIIYNARTKQKKHDRDRDGRDKQIDNQTLFVHICMQYSLSLLNTAWQPPIATTNVFSLLPEFDSLHQWIAQASIWYSIVRLALPLTGVRSYICMQSKARTEHEDTLWMVSGQTIATISRQGYVTALAA